MKHLLFSVLLIFTGCASQQHVITGHARPMISPEAVKVYSVAPEKSEVIGTVSCNVPSGFSHYLTHPEVGMLKNEAAQLGANGLVVGEGKVVIFTGYQISGVAIYVP